MSNPSPHLTNNVERVYPEFFRVSTLYRVGEREGGGERELQENFEKDALFYKRIQKWQKNMNIVLLSRGHLFMIEARTMDNYYTLLRAEATFSRREWSG